MKKIGVLSYQGDFQKHLAVINSIGAVGIGVRDVDALDRCDGLIIPGGESTTIGMLMERFGILERLKGLITGGFPVFGTCAGAILLAGEIEDSSQPRIGMMDMSVHRNAYGRQVESFESDLRPTTDGAALGWEEPPVHGVFIRAPIITRIWGDTKPLLEFEESPVVVQHGSLLAATFHPELIGDDRIHRYFLTLVA